MGQGVGLVGHSLIQGVLPPPGFLFLTDSDGAILTDSDGAYLIEAI